MVFCKHNMHVIDALKAAGQAVPALLKLASGRSFYRVEDGKLEFLTVGGEYRPVVRPAGVLLLEDVKRATKPLAKNGSAALWEYAEKMVQKAVDAGHLAPKP